MTGRMLAVLDETGVLVERIADPSDEQWDAALAHTRFEGGFDNALKRYRLIEWKPGKWRFDPLVHRKDLATENVAAEINIEAVLSRAVLKLSAGAAVDQADLDELALWLTTMEAK